jgi:hypothetical protein
MSLRTVTILGLAAAELKTTTLAELTANEVWTLNDYYQFYPCLVPQRIYNVHRSPWVHPSPMRYVGDWRAEYNAAAALGASIIVTDPIDGVNNQVMLPEAELLATYAQACMTCQIATMIYHAIIEGVDELNIRGVVLYDDEYRTQVLGILQAIDTAREVGIIVNCAPEAEWRKTADPKTVDWAGIEDYVAYWRR